MQLSLKRQRVSRIVLWVVGGAAVVAAVILVATMVIDTGIKADQYQLVKLTTGEIFFGKLQNTKGDYLVLQGAYFIQDNKESTDTTILSRKNTVARSESPMRIKADKVVYWENLAKDSKITKLMQDNSNQ